jgi:predicted metal-dependent phosphoesterase TrpH
MIDLHTHTNCSDGTDSPRELVNKAIVLGLEVLGISDHDTTSSWKEATETLRGSLKFLFNNRWHQRSHVGAAL